MDLAIVCPDCLGTGVRISVVGYRTVRDDPPDGDSAGEMVVPLPCSSCAGSGRITTSGWS